ncbi:MAG: MarR family transcriptional regulator [Rickettsiales bacterium]|jgi:DNA-binding MarR family transcriptional regulator|nr:MarR family transcriptional regulator [Rickettsiales bacterium]
MVAKEEKIGSSKMVRALSFWHGVTATALKKMPIDLSARQQAVLLNVYLVQGPHSVKSLSDELAISKPAICRAIDALEGAKLVKRQRDKSDKRNVYVQRTVKGSVYLSEFADIIMTQSKEAA